MGKKKGKAGGGLGRALINSQHQRRPDEQRLQQFMTDPTARDTTPLRSVTEQNDLEAFLTDAVLQDTEFAAARERNMTIVTPTTVPERLQQSEQKLDITSNLWAETQQIPRRPQWDHTTTPGQLDQNERASFLDWRRNLARIEEEKGLLMTPFEKNLEVWRQLWRVVERSHLIVQVIDARNPLLFRSNDLETYVHEVDPTKRNLLLINKADLLTQELRREWAKYFTKDKVDFVFFSAAREQEKIDLKEQQEKDGEEDEESEQGESDGLVVEGEVVGVELDKERVVGAVELLEIVRKAAPSGLEKVIVGMVGFPNVGKSSTINVLVGTKKVAVSSTPGKTKHFQTLIIDESMTLCDCPGLVFPRMASSKAEMVLDGVLPIDQLRDATLPSQLLCDRIDRHFLEDMYCVVLPRPPAGDNSDRGLLGTELLSTYAGMRGFMTSRGLPDESRAARIILKDYVNGHLLYCNFPPGLERAGVALQGTSKRSALAEENHEIKQKQRMKAAENQTRKYYDDDEIFQEEMRSVNAVVRAGGKKGKKGKKKKGKFAMEPPQRHHLPMPVSELRQAVKNQRVAEGTTS